MNWLIVDEIIKNALKEDIPSEDITTIPIVTEDSLCSVNLISKEDGILAGAEVFARVFYLLGEVDVSFNKEDGDILKKGEIIAIIKGKTKNVLLGERVALNLLQRMCGIATLTNNFSKKLIGTNAKLADTRKTTPNLRILEKYSVKIGGGINHRCNLSDGILIKDNHIDAAGSITNAINLIDGIDGLASGLSSVALLVFGLLFIEKGLWMYSMLAFSTLGVLVPFFYYNVFGNAERARKIFMGDTGSLTLGYILSFLAIKYSQNNPEVISNTKGTFLIAFSTLIIPAFDVIRVVMVRLRNGKSPFEPDKNHIHHKFLAMGFTPRKAMIIIILISCAFSVVNILLIPWVNNTVILIGDIVAWIALNLWWDKVRDKRTHLNRLY